MKYYKRIISFLLVLVIAVSLCGCSSSGSVVSKKEEAAKKQVSDVLVGKWTSQSVDLVQIVKSWISEQSSTIGSYLEQYEMPAVLCTMNAEFQEDGTFHIYLDSSTLNESMDVLYDLIEKAYQEYLVEKYPNAGKTIDSILKKVGLSADSLISKEDLINSLAIDFAKGAYYIENDHITLVVPSGIDSAVYDPQSKLLTVGSAEGKIKFCPMVFYVAH